MVLAGEHHRGPLPWSPGYEIFMASKYAIKSLALIDFSDISARALPAPSQVNEIDVSNCSSQNERSSGSEWFFLRVPGSGAEEPWLSCPQFDLIYTF
jgi:hypothetical protein